MVQNVRGAERQARAVALQDHASPDLRAPGEELQARLRSEDEQAIKENHAMLDRLQAASGLHSTGTPHAQRRWLILDLRGHPGPQGCRRRLYLKGLGTHDEAGLGSSSFMSHIAIGAEDHHPRLPRPRRGDSHIGYYQAPGLQKLQPAREAREGLPCRSSRPSRTRWQRRPSAERETKRHCATATACGQCPSQARAGGV